MALETATYIDDLVATNPVSSDGLGQVDDHIRLIKSVLKATFPNITGAVTLTDAQINAPFPSGGIVMWSGTVATIPSGWAICDGTNGTPNLTGKFIVHADADTGGTYAPGATGGQDNVTLVSANLPAHTHNVGTLAVANGGSHSHTGSTGSAGLHKHEQPGGTGPDHAAVTSRKRLGGYDVSGNALDPGTVIGAFSMWTEETGSHTHTVTINTGGSHSHSLTGSTGSVGSGTSFDNRPAFYALAYIMKL